MTTKLTLTLSVVSMYTVDYLSTPFCLKWWTTLATTTNRQHY